MKTILAAIGTIAVATSLTYALDGEEHVASGDSHLSASSSPTSFILQANGVECAVYKSQADSKAARLSLGSGCEGSAHPAREAAYWTERDDGSVAFLAPNGKPLIQFAAAEGGAYVSYDPPSPLISLVAKP